MLSLLLPLVVCAGASQVAMRGHHHHHHHHASSGGGDGGNAGQMDQFMKGGKFDEEGFKDSIANGMESGKDIDTASLPSSLQGLAQAAKSGDENSLLDSIQQMAGSKSDENPGDLHLKNEDGAQVYDLRGVFHTQTLPPLTVTEEPPAAVLKTMKTTMKTTTTTTKTTTTTSTSASAKSVAQSAMQPKTQSLVQPMSAAAQPVQQSQPVGAAPAPLQQQAMQPMQPTVGQASMPFPAPPAQQQQVQQFQQFQQQPLQQFQQYPQQNAFLPQQMPQIQATPAGSTYQAIQTGLGAMMQSVNAMSNEAAAAARAEMVQQQVQATEQMDHNALEQLQKRISTLETSQKSAGHISDPQVQSQLQAESSQLLSQSAAVKDESDKTQDILKRLGALENVQKNKKEDDKETDIVRRLDELEKKVKHHEVRKLEAMSNHTEVALKDVQSQLSAMKEQLDATKKENIELRTEVQQLKVKQETMVVSRPKKPPPSHSKKDDEDDDDDDDVSMLQFGHRHWKFKEEPMRSIFHRKSRHGINKK